MRNRAATIKDVNKFIAFATCMMGLMAIFMSSTIAWVAFHTSKEANSISSVPFWGFLTFATIFLGLGIWSFMLTYKAIRANRI